MIPPLPPVDPTDPIGTASVRARLRKQRGWHIDAKPFVSLDQNLLWLGWLIALMAFGFGGCARVHAMAPA